MIRLLIISLLSSAAVMADTATERQHNAYFCNDIGGQAEVPHEYTLNDGTTRYVIADCETDDAVYESGLDKRSSLDSVQQALFFHHLTGKEPRIVIFDRDNREGAYEYQIRQACEYVLMICLVIPAHEL